MSQPPKIFIKPGDSFIRKYILQELHNNPLNPKQRIIEEGETLHADFTIEAHDAHVQVSRAEGESVTLRFPLVIGTGMSGVSGRMARMIYHGTYFHVKDNDARVSVIHATDVAAAVRIALTNGAITGDFTISDGTDPTRRELAEGLAWRMGQKRIYSLSKKKFAIIARWADRLGISAFNSKQLHLLTTDALVDSTAWAEAAGNEWHPQSTVDYLRTHVYDEHSL